MIFQIGDKVRRVNNSWRGMKVGDIGTVHSFDSLGGVRLEEFDGGHSKSNLELVRYNWREVLE